jgi:DNA ligase-1
MLAATLKDASEVQYPVLASPKYDGIRCVIRDGLALSRALKPIANKHIRNALQALGSHGEGLDGEIMLPYPATFQAVSSAVMAYSDVPPSDWFFVVFDRVHLGDAFAKRIANVKRTVDAHANERLWRHVVACEHMQIDSDETLATYEVDMLAAGHEGVMLRALDGPYKFGRATLKEGYLSKLKRFLDSEAEIIGVLELQHNRNAAFVGELGQTKRRTLKQGKVDGGVMGKFVVRDLKTGVEFKIGTGVGMTAQKRALWWRIRDTMIGRVVRYRFQGHGVKDKPRIASLQGFRDRRDMDASP